MGKLFKEKMFPGEPPAAPEIDTAMNKMQRAFLNLVNKKNTAAEDPRILDASPFKMFGSMIKDKASEKSKINADHIFETRIRVDDEIFKKNAGDRDPDILQFQKSKQNKMVSEKAREYYAETKATN